MVFAQECQRKPVVKLLQIEELEVEKDLAANRLNAKKNNCNKKNIDFIKINKKGKKHISNTLVIRKLFNKNLNDSLKVGYIVSKKLGGAVKRNRAKRIMRELVRRNMHKYGKYNNYYLLIAKKKIFDTSFKNLEEEFLELLLKNE